MFLLVFPSHFSIFASRKKTFEFHIRKLCVLKPQGKMLAPVLLCLQENYFEVVQFSAVVHEEEQKRKDLIRFSFNGCSHTSATFFLQYFFFSSLRVIFFARGSRLSLGYQESVTCFSSAAKTKAAVANIKLYAFTLL